METYHELAEKIRANVPIKAIPNRKLADELNQKLGSSISPRDRLTIKNALDARDARGILCQVEMPGLQLPPVPLTQLVVADGLPLSEEIKAYQRNFPAA